MRKPGPRIGEHEETTKARVFQLIPEDPPGIRFTDIVRAARKLGYTKPTVWRYLDRFEDLDLIIHEGRFYRRNPLSGGNARFHIKTGMGLHEFGFDELREVRLENLWDPRDKKRLWKFGDRTIAENPKVLYDSLLNHSSIGSDGLRQSVGDREGGTQLCSGRGGCKDHDDIRGLLFSHATSPRCVGP